MDKAGKGMAELTKATGKRNKHDEAICWGYEDSRDELREVLKDVVRETEPEVPMEAGPEFKHMVSEETASLDEQENAKRRILSILPV